MKQHCSFCVAIAVAGIFLFGACNKADEIIVTDSSPVITFDAEDHVYQVKVGRELLLEPVVTNNENAAYRWLLDGVTVGREATYRFSSDESGEYYLTFEVTNPASTASEEVRIDVLDELPPHITLAVPEDGLSLLVGTARTFRPVVANSDDSSFRWTVDGSTVADTKEYTFLSESIGEFAVEFRAANEDGQECIRFTIKVLDAGDMPFSWEWEKDLFIATVGRTVVLEPVSVTNVFDPVYSWYMGEVLLQQDTDPAYSFTPDAAGIYILTVELDSQYAAMSKKITVEVFDNEDENLRAVTAGSSADAVKVWEFLPAPGQFVNEYKRADGSYIEITTPEQACAYALDEMNNRRYVSLGAFGGYIVVGFDHSVVNDGGYNIQILGNAFDGSSEPGIVWVMQDENGDGLPNDTWYELKGSEYDSPEMIYNYAVTYYRPSAPGMDVAWTDNLGNEGTVDYLKAYHPQNYYYPGWVQSGSYTLRGTRLQDKTYDRSGNGSYWVNGNFDWGYADNYGSDRLADDGNAEAGVSRNHFRIGDAVDRNGNPVHLKYIDFVKVQTAVQAKAGWLGENSTEVTGFRDYNMLKATP
ncbi:MAG: cell surface protein [Rikenellaceae bacterium]|nr:cell surface protein [Rikenellaceae bacterium]